jgi:hypothetical protein
LASALKPFPAAHSSQASPENPWLHVQVHPPVVPPTVPCAASHAMVAAAPDVPAVQSDAVEQSAPSYPALHVQLHPPVVPPTVP